MQNLLKRINAKRDSIRVFTSKHGPKNKLLLNVSIVCGVVGTALEGIPAVGGSEAIETIKEMAKPGLPVWHLLCIGAALMTMAATLATSMRSNHDTGTKLSKAQCVTLNWRCLNCCCKMIKLIPGTPLKNMENIQLRFRL